MPTKFQWPPNPLPPMDVGPPSDPRYWRTPPSPTAATPALTPPISPKAAPLPPLSPSSPSPLRHIETTFLGLTRPTLANRLADDAWRPDPTTAYCPRCATSVGPHEADANGCTACRHLKLTWDRAARLGPYTGVLRDIIHEVKFSAWRRLGLDIGRLYATHLAPLLTHADPARTVIVPIPSSFWRRLFRGIDHTATIAKGAQQVLGCHLAPALARRHRRPQVGLSPTDRRRNVAGSMFLQGRPQFEGCTILLLDDVRTTGATMTEAAKALRKGLKALSQTPAEIWCCTLAVVGSSPDAHSPP